MLLIFSINLVKLKKLTDTNPIATLYIIVRNILSNISAPWIRRNQCKLHIKLSLEIGVFVEAAENISRLYRFISRYDSFRKSFLDVVVDLAASI
jgi:hypothetical protein